MKSKKKKLAPARFIISVETYGMGIQDNVFA